MRRRRGRTREGGEGSDKAKGQQLLASLCTGGCELPAAKCASNTDGTEVPELSLEFYASDRSESNHRNNFRGNKTRFNKACSTFQSGTHCCGAPSCVRGRKWQLRKKTTHKVLSRGLLFSLKRRAPVILYSELSYTALIPVVSCVIVSSLDRAMTQRC